MGEPFLGLAHVAPRLNCLKALPYALPRYEYLSGGLVWPDEYPKRGELDFDRIGCLRALWN
jgi:hypothetical protein